MSAEETVLTEQPAAAQTVEAAPASEAAKPENETRIETLTRLAKNPVQRERGPAALKPAVQPAIAPSERPAFPKSLKKELESHWNSAPTELLNGVIERESSYEKGIREYSTKAKQADEILSEIKPYEMLLKTEGTTPKAAIGSLLQTAALLRSGTPAQKAQAVAQTMRQYGIPIEHIQQMLAGQAPQQQAIAPQQVEQMVNQRFTAFQQQQEDARAQAVISQFEKDPAFKHFAAVRSTMGAIMQDSEFLARTSGMPESEQLKEAYQSAIYANPAVREKVLAEQQAEIRSKQQVEAAKKASVLVRGAPRQGPPPKINPSDRRGTIAAIVAAARG